MTRISSTGIARAAAISRHGWQIWHYRGAEIRTQGYRAVLHLPGHPYDRQGGLNFDLARQMVDAWLDSPARRPFLAWPSS